LQQEFPDAPVLLMSATISQTDAKYVTDSIGLEDVKLVRCPQMIRPELIYEVWRKKENRNETLDHLQSIIEYSYPGCCIIYCGTPAKSTKLFEDLTAHVNNEQFGIHHGKLTEKEKDDVLQKWQNGSCRTMIATSSFGMGIHAPDVRSVVHYVFPISISTVALKSIPTPRS
jgi:ATP-dependent DNA helicase RecQ